MDTASRKRDAAMIHTSLQAIEKASHGNAKPATVVGTSPFQLWEAQSFSTMPYRPHTIGLCQLCYIASPGFDGKERYTPLGCEARRCYLYDFFPDAL